MERSDPAAWETRFDWTLTALMLAAYALAIYITGFTPGAGSRHLWAAIVAGAYVVTLQILPRRLREQEIIGEITAVVGVIALTVSIGLTDADNAGYTMLLVAPIFFASAFIGFRIGMETALLATIGLVAVLLVNGDSVVDNANIFALYLLVGFTLAQARRMLVLEQSLSASLRAASVVDAARLNRLEEAHALLVDLTEVAGTTDLSAQGVGSLALKELGERFDIVGGEVIDSNDEPVAGFGDHGDRPPMVISVDGSNGALGHVHLWPADGVTIARDDPHLMSTLSGLALAFDNIKLLGTVASRAVQDERTRVARDLHDHIGPELASLGLTLDVLATTSGDDVVVSQISTLRDRTTLLIEHIRQSVADLRHADMTTVSDHLQRLVLERGVELPSVTVDIDERHPLTGVLAVEVSSIVTEALRNVDRHAGASAVHIVGQIDQYGGYIAVQDDGVGFDGGKDFPGHFGLVGMKERAAAIGGRLRITSNLADGSTVEVTWGNRNGRD